MKNTLTALLCLLIMGSVSQAEDWGTLKGKILLDGDVPAPVLQHKKGAPGVKDASVCAAQDTLRQDLLIDKTTKGVANIFVYIYKKPKSIHPDAEKAPAKVIFDQKNCVFKPHALVLQAGQTVEVLNSDAIAHNTHTYPLRNRAENILVAPNTKKGEGVDIGTKTREILPHKVTCDYHGWMSAYWLVMDHPYAAATDEKGNFEIKNLPVGKHEFRIWHERPGYLDKAFEVEVKKGDNEPLVIKYKLDKFSDK